MIEILEKLEKYISELKKIPQGKLLEHKNMILWMIDLIKSEILEER